MNFALSLCAIISDVTVATVSTSALERLARDYAVSPAFAIGLGSGLYFEYFRRSQPSPTHYIEGLHRETETRLSGRLKLYREEPHQGLREALRENALWFNLDRAPTTALLGMEMLAEELPYFDRLEDWRMCLRCMGDAIVGTDALYRRTYVKFLVGIAPQIANAAALAVDLQDITAEWEFLAEHLSQSTNSSSELEQLSGLVRRLALREEHFWGTIVDTVD